MSNIILKNSKFTILIIGNLGYIGSLLTKYLKDHISDCYLIGIDTAFFSGCVINPTFCYDHLIDNQLHFDVRSLFPPDFPYVDCVIYLSAVSNDPMGKQFEIPTIDINFNSAVKVAKFFKKRGTKSFIFASSCSIYGSAGDSPKSESDTLNPLTTYAKSKIDAELGLSELSDSNFLITCLRFATACGVSPRLRLDLVLNDFVVSGLLNKRIDILSDGMPWRPLIDVRDMCFAINWAIFRNSSPTSNFLAVNVGFNNWNFRIKDLAFAVSEVLNGIEININDSAAPDKRSYMVNFSLYEKLCLHNYSLSSRKLTDSINDLIELINISNFRTNDFRNSYLIRLNVLNKLRSLNKLDDSLFWI